MQVRTTLSSVSLEPHGRQGPTYRAPVWLKSVSPKKGMTTDPCPTLSLLTYSVTAAAEGYCVGDDVCVRGVSVSMPEDESITATT